MAEIEERVRYLEQENTSMSAEFKLLRQEMHSEIRLLSNNLEIANKNIEKFNRIIGKILFIIGGGFIAAFLAWVFKGGLNV